MAEGVSSSAGAAGTTTSAAAAASRTKSSTRFLWPSVLRWIPTSTDHIIASEKRLLSLVKTPYQQEQVNIGSGPPGSKVRWFRSASDEPRFINTVTFDSTEDSPTLVMVHGYGASQGFFFRNFDALAKHFRVIAIDQLGNLLFFNVAAGVDQADLTLRAKALKKRKHGLLILSRNGGRPKTLATLFYLDIHLEVNVAARYALKHPEHIKHLVLVGSAGFSSETDARSEPLIRFRATWKGAVLSHLWESNLTPQKIIRGFGPFGPDLVQKYTSSRFGAYSTGEVLTEEETRLLTDYVYHTLAAKASGELCLKHIFAFGAFTRVPLLQSASEWKVPTTFIYGCEDWMWYGGAQEARKQMKVPCEIIRVPQAGHFVFIDNPTGFHSAVLYACRRFLSSAADYHSLPEGLISA